jgi:hypothetical protein
MKNVSWEDPPYQDYEQYLQLCHKSVPSDFFFSVSEDSFSGIGCSISICPKLYFQKENDMWDQSMDLDHILPSDLFEAMESVWTSERSMEDVRNDLLSRGFEENANLEID